MAASMALMAMRNTPLRYTDLSWASSMPSRCTTKQKYLDGGIFFMMRSMSSALVHM